MKVTLERIQSGAPLTPRERWYCFYRLFRLARKRDEQSLTEAASPDQPAMDALRMLGYSGWIWKLVNGVDAMSTALVRTKCLKERFLERARKERLYGRVCEHYEELKTKDQAVARLFRESEGRELTLIEAAEERHKAFRLLRQQMRARGMFVHEGDGSDVYILRAIRKIRREQK